MTQALYAHMNNNKTIIKKRQTAKFHVFGSAALN
jgi:hypothetical protein